MLTRSSAVADKHARRACGSVNVIESGTIRQLWYGFLLVFYSNFVSRMHRF